VEGGVLGRWVKCMHGAPRCLSVISRPWTWIQQRPASSGQQQQQAEWMIQCQSVCQRRAGRVSVAAAWS
jgi:hypothetical protein